MDVPDFVEVEATGFSGDLLRLFVLGAGASLTAAVGFDGYHVSER